MTPTNPSSEPIWPIGWTVRRVLETGSTNDDLVAAAHAGAVDRTAIVAEYQTAGKGRLDRTWDATRGSNLLVSLLFRYQAEHPTRFARIVALACRAACARLVGEPIALKWPNDLVVDDRKLAGLLAVAVPQERFVVVGIGVNVGWAPDGAVRLLDVGQSGASANVTPLALLAAMLERIDARRSQGDDELRREHTSALATLGTRVRVELQAGATLVGMAHDVDDESRLIVVGDDGVRHVIDVGDVVHLRAR